jgi:hypothetical protein
MFHVKQPASFERSALARAWFHGGVLRFVRRSSASVHRRFVASGWALNRVAGSLGVAGSLPDLPVTGAGGVWPQRDRCLPSVAPESGQAKRVSRETPRSLGLASG